MKKKTSKRQLNSFPSKVILIGGALVLILVLGLWFLSPKSNTEVVELDQSPGALTLVVEETEVALVSEPEPSGLYGVASGEVELQEEGELESVSYPDGGMDEPLDTPEEEKALVAGTLAEPQEEAQLVEEQEEVGSADLPRLALVIDDMGNRLKLGKTLVEMDLHLNFAILPHSPYGLKLAEMAQDRGRDVLLHLPMEAVDKKWNPGPGALYLAMSDETIRKTVAEDLAQVPMAVGISNHMGSIFSENRQAMETFLKELKPRNLFFIDSLTSSKSLGHTIAQELGLKSAKRNVFLDNVQEEDKIIKQLEKLISIAQKQGQAIGLGHPHPATLKALQSFQETLKQKVTLVPIHQLVK